MGLTFGDGIPDGLSLVAIEVVHDDGVAGSDFRRQALGHMHFEDGPIHEAI